MKPGIILVDDDNSGRNMLAGFLEKHGFNVSAFDNAESALETFSREGFDLALLDVKLPGMSGIELTSKLKSIDPTLPVILITAYGDIGTAVSGMKAGAADYLTKPVELQELELVIEKQLENRRLILENKLLREQLSDNKPDYIVAESRQMKEILSTISRISATDTPVLVTGESGVGKELVARIIHENSGFSGAFIPINCAAIPENLIESELFGAEPGAYTSANKRKQGKIELANNGTLFLDEIAELPLMLQPKLLRFLQEGTFFRLGGTQELSPNVRVLAATNRNVEELVAQKKMREDLYFRLAVIKINIPPLRERHEDLAVLAENFVAKFAEKHGKAIKELSRKALNTILRHKWPGNVRELANSIERAVLLTRHEILSPEDLQLLPQSLVSESELLCDVEKNHIEKVLKETGWHLANASERLGIHRNTLRNKMNEYNIHKPE